MLNFESDDESSNIIDSELGMNPRNKQSVNIKQSHISSQSIEDHVNNTECENSDVENENVNEDNRGIKEIENERKRNEAMEIIMRNVSDSNSFKETKNDKDDEAWNDVAELRQWAIQARIQHCHLDSLLRILRRRLIPNLPATSKTFLKTESANYQIKEFRSSDGTIIGKFVYFGIAAGLRRYVNKEIHVRDTLDLQINCDGSFI